MRVALFFDGKNFYSGWKERTPRCEIDYEKLSDWLVKRVGGDNLWGAYWYTGIERGPESDSEGQKKLSGFLDMLERRPGFFVQRLTRKILSTRCPTCGADNRYSQETEVDTSIVADMLRMAATGCYDIAVLLSGDADHIPALEALRMMGTQAYIASWGGGGLSPRARKAAFDHIDLLSGIGEFSAGDPERFIVDENADGTADEQLALAFVQELERAEEFLNPGFVGLNFFVTRWNSSRLESTPEARRRLLDRLVKEGLVEVYEAGNGDKAIRVVMASTPD